MSWKKFLKLEWKKSLLKIEKIKITENEEEMLESKYFIDDKEVSQIEYELQAKRKSLFEIKTNLQLPGLLSISPISYVHNFYNETKKYLVFS